MKLRNLFVLALILQACVKTKVENVIPPLSVLNSTPSSIRLFNFSAYDMDVKVNNNPLTSFIINATTGGTALGLSIFPSGKCHIPRMGTRGISRRKSWIRTAGRISP